MYSSSEAAEAAAEGGGGGRRREQRGQHRRADRRMRRGRRDGGQAGPVSVASSERPPSLSGLGLSICCLPKWVTRLTGKGGGKPERERGFLISLGDVSHHSQPHAGLF